MADPLRDAETGLLSAAFLAEAAPLLLAQWQRRAVFVSVVLLRPADGAAGLAVAAAQAAALLRAGDLRCRLGPDRMLLLLPDCDIGAACERMHLL
ncbi:MAG: hypothetical protein RMK64_10820, partial [Rhodovarius sp.]|nr:hypothetical protein [Rhodovarius sp.]